jgi:AcrR family transcriptional regulator
MLQTTPNLRRGAGGRVDYRERLCDAALVLFRHQGYERTAVDQITWQAGLSKGTFFNYFPNKETLLRYLGGLGFAKLGVGAFACAGSAQGTPAAQIAQMLIILAAYLESERELLRLVLRQGIGLDALRAGDAGGFSIHLMAASLLHQAQGAGQLAGDLDAELLALVLDTLYCQELVRWCKAERSYPLAERLVALVHVLLAQDPPANVAARADDAAGGVESSVRTLPGQPDDEPRVQ